MLTDRAVRGLAPKRKPYKKSDAGGLYIEVRPNGSKWWRFKYQFAGKSKLLSMGTYPRTSLKAARKKRDDARIDLESGIDPSAKRKAEKASAQTAAAAPANTFKAVAADWLERNTDLKPGTVRQLERRLDTYVYPQFGSKPIGAIGAPDVLMMLRAIEAKGIHETAHRVRSLVSRVFRFAVASGLAERDPAADLVDALTKVKSTNFSAITRPARIGELLRAIDGYQGQPSVMYALRLAPLVFVRPGELRAAQWTEFDLEAAEWRIPAERMKMDAEHVVPLSKQAVRILEELQQVTGADRLLFPSLRSNGRPISNNTMNAALRRMGFGAEEMTAHGFRTTASTRLNELGFDPDVIELQLAHTDRNKVRAAYNRATKLAERQKMMQTWADYLDGLKRDHPGKIRAIRESRDV